MQEMLFVLTDILTLNCAVIPRSVLHPACEQPLHKTKRQVDGEDFLTLKDSTGTVIQSHGEDGARDETVPDIEPVSLNGYEFVHKIDENATGPKQQNIFQTKRSMQHLLEMGTWKALSLAIR